MPSGENYQLIYAVISYSIVEIRLRKEGLLSHQGLVIKANARVYFQMCTSPATVACVHTHAQIHRYTHTHTLAQRNLHLASIYTLLDHYPRSSSSAIAVTLQRPSFPTLIYIYLSLFTSQPICLRRKRFNFTNSSLISFVFFQKILFLSPLT